MRTILMGAMMAGLAGCSAPDGPTNMVAPTATLAAATAAMPGAAQAVDATVADSRTVPVMGVLKTFGDWTVGCDNGLTCTMASLLPEGDFDSQVTMAATRAPGLPGAWQVSVDTRDAATASTLLIDGKPVGGALRDGEATGDPAAAIVAAMAAARTVQARAAGGAVVGAASSKGAAAALRYIDAMQGRADGQSAVVARGSATTAPLTPALPVIVAITASGTPSRPSAAQVTAMRRQADCDLPEGVDLTPETAALGGGKTLVLLPCSTGAYNLSSALFVIDGESVSPAMTDAPSGFTEGDGPAQIASVVNGGFADGVLSSYAKGRGIGDCGVAQDFVWDGKRLRLSKQAAMDECRGNTALVSIWAARVVRR